VLRVAIPGGVWRHDSLATDAPARELGLRPVDGEDETFLLDSMDRAAPGTRATALLARCLTDSDAQQTVRSLTVGDREALLLHLRRLTLGETVDCAMDCPAPSCGERLQLALRTSDLLVAPYADVRREYELSIDAGGAHYAVLFRLPNAGDLDWMASVAAADPAQAAQALFERCVTRTLRDGVDVPAHALDPAVRDAVAAAMAEHDPQAEIELDLACPACGAAFAIVFDTAMFFLQELDQRALQLTREVHALASTYHWSEHDILRMPRRRRSVYLDLIADAAARARAR
jgi:hypothetical protein